MLSVPISKTKIIIPHRRPELLSRTRLLESLSALLDRKLILLSAPAGYGKTSLLIDLAHSVSQPVCWLSLDSLDRDPQRFMAYLIAALGEQFPGVARPALARLNELKSLDEDVEALLVTLTNELYEQVEQDFLLVIDDVHLVEDVPAIMNLLNRFIQLVDENCHLILSSRTLPNLPDFTLMVARDQVDGLSYSDLAFLPQEVQALFMQNFHQHLSEEQARQLVEQTGGWITGMILSSIPGSGHVSGVNTFSYLGRQVLDQQPEDLRLFLLRTSLPMEFNASLCEIMLAPFYSEPPNWTNLMNQVVEKNLFALPVGNNERWLRYHPLFRDFLQARLREERPQEVRPILQRLTYAYEQLGEWEKAYFTCQQLGDSEALADVVERAGTPMLQRAVLTLEGWLNSLPPSLVHQRPGLLSLRGAIFSMKGNVVEGVALLDQAEVMYRQKGEKEGLALTLTRRAAALRQAGEYAASLKDAEEALRLSEPHAQMQAIYAEALRNVGLCYYRLGKSHQAIEYLERSLSLYTTLKEVGSIPLLLIETGMAQATTGNIESAKVSYQKALQIWQAENNLYWQANLLNNLAVIHHQIGEYEQACQYFETGLIYARKSRNRRTEALILLGLGDLYAEVEEFESADQAYQSAENLITELAEPFLRKYLCLALGGLAVAQRDLKAAQSVLRSSQKEFENTPSAYERGLWALLQGRMALLREQPEQAIALFCEARLCFTQDGRDLESMQSRVWLIAAWLQAGKWEEAQEEIGKLFPPPPACNHALLVTLHQAMPWLKEGQQGYFSGRSWLSLLEKSRRFALKLPTIRRSLRRLAQSIPIPSASLSIQAFGRPEVRLNGRLLTMADWRTQSVRDLFFYFLYKREAVTKEQISEALWPEIDDPQILKARFKDQIYRLRRAAGREVILFENEYYRFNRALDYDYDVEAFETYLARARATKSKEERIEHYQKAVDLVRGPYLANVDTTWALFERERLEQAFLAALAELAKLYEETNQPEKAMRTCQCALEHDPSREEFHRQLMRIYASLGDRAGLARQYRACQAALEELGLHPSEETEALYRKLAF